jgi:hypothetical protein
MGKAKQMLEHHLATILQDLHLDQSIIMVLEHQAHLLFLAGLIIYLKLTELVLTLLLVDL